MTMGTMEKAFAAVGMFPPHPVRSYKHREQKCRKCGSPMRFIEDSNVMCCSECGNYFIFDGTKSKKKF